MDLSIIIPTYNEAARIGRLIHYLRAHAKGARVFVANSPCTTDDTARVAEAAGAEVFNCPTAGRAQQMNYAAAHTRGELIYFVHADTVPPKTFVKDIEEAMRSGVRLGYFRYRFDSDRLMLRINSYCTRFDGLFAGGGDQTLFICRNTFLQLGGFREELRLMEDFDLVKRARAADIPHRLIQRDAVVSARKYQHNSWLRVNLVNLWVFLLFHCGMPTDRLCGMYRKLLRTE